MGKETNQSSKDDDETDEFGLEIDSLDLDE